MSIRLCFPLSHSQVSVLVQSTSPQTPANGQTRWDAAALNFAIQELRREFPAFRTDVIVQAVGWVASGLRPESGRVVLLRRIRDHLKNLSAEGPGSRSPYSIKPDPAP